MHRMGAILSSIRIHSKTCVLSQRKPNPSSFPWQKTEGRELCGRSKGTHELSEDFNNPVYTCFVLKHLAYCKQRYELLVGEVVDLVDPLSEATRPASDV